MKFNFNKLKLNISVASLILLLIMTSFSFSFNIEEADAAFNEQINYQGKLTDTSDSAVADGAWRMKFRLYTDETGGSAIWTEDRSTAPGDRITLTSGLFSVMLGSSTSLTNIDFNQTLYLGVEICGLGSEAETCDGEMTPRKILGAVPAAFEAGRLEGLYSSQFLRSDALNATSTSSTFLTVTQSGSGKIAEFFGPNSSSVLSLLSGGNVGIGTTTPYAMLSVAGETVAEYFTATSTAATSTLPYLTATSLKITGFCEGCFTLNGLTPGTQTFAVGTSGSDFNISSSISVHTFNIPDASPSARGVITTGTQTLGGDKTFNGNVQMNDLIGGGAIAIFNNTGVIFNDSSQAGLDFRVESDNYTHMFFLDAGLDRVAIGTSSPYAKLAVWGQGTGSATLFELVNSASTTVFSVLDDGTTEIGAASAGNVVIQTSTTGDVVFLGVGTSTPDADVAIVSNQVNSNTYLFTVATTTGDVIDRKFTIDSDGDVATDGSLTSPADYAEAFAVMGSKKNYEPGDIVVLSEALPGGVEKSSKPYEKNVAGVYSTKPGIIGTLARDTTAYRMEEENDIPVGILGRIPTKVSAENGSIKVGDHITTSSIPGVGMKATKPGKSIGRALESFNEDGVGKIMVFVQNGYFFGEDFLALEEEFTNLGSFFASSTNPEDSGNNSAILLVIQTIFDYFESVGFKIINGIAYFKQIVVEHLVVGSPEKPSGITLYDEVTGEPYCLSVRGGEIVNRPGQCNDLLDEETSENNPSIDSSGVGAGSSQSTPLSEDENIAEDIHESEEPGEGESGEVPEEEIPEVPEEGSVELESSGEDSGQEAIPEESEPEAPPESGGTSPPESESPSQPDEESTPPPGG